MKNQPERMLRRLRKCEAGSSTIELAIILPVLLILFAGSAELGRLFYTYTTLAKATKVGARFLSTQLDTTSTDSAKLAAVKLKAQNLVIYGCTDRTVSPCSTAAPIVAGMTATTNVKVTFPATTVGPKYVKVEIQSYTYSPGVFNLASFTGKASSAFYFGLSPGTEMRYIP